MRRNNASITAFLLVLFLYGGPLQADSTAVSVDSTTASGNPVTPAPIIPRVWAIVQPLQCLGNPWEQDWVAHHEKSEVYPQRDEKQILKAFFAQNQIQILDIRVRPYDGGPLCQTCDCPRGDTLYLLVSAENAPLLKSFGYDKTLPAKQ